jgi:hypothetical protein
MSQDTRKTTRTALSWDQEFKEPGVKDLRAMLLQMSNAKTVGNIEIFRLCLAIGYESGVKRPVPPRASDAVRIGDLKETDSALFRIIAIDEEKNGEILLDENKIYDVVEQYAAQGLLILCQEMARQPSFADWLNSRLFKSLKRQLAG